jgi:hypothetical protein
MCSGGCACREKIEHLVLGEFQLLTDRGGIGGPMHLIAAAQRERDGELPQRQIREHVFTQVRLGLDHAPHPIRRGRRGIPCRKRQDLLAATAVATDPREASLEDSQSSR